MDLVLVGIVDNKEHRFPLSEGTHALIFRLLTEPDITLQVISSKSE